MPLDPDHALLLGTDCPSMRSLARVLGADLLPLPSPESPDRFEAWRGEVGAGPPHEQLIVSVWNDEPSRKPILDLEVEAWEGRLERPYLLWNLALGAAARRCRDGGSITALVQTPAALDSAGWTPEMSIGDGVVALVRSLAASEGRRGVRANTVTTPLGLVGPGVIAPPPPLGRFPGRLEDEVAGAIRLLLSPDSIGLTGRVLPADCGRSLP